ncbi:helix-hairpin-helix domain-containing protein [Acetobacter conturbans]|uniref:General secretion pathway protein GspK n=1 Tax=Acetobacter conturbans TaxID=1737472 RepID=A0ABX0K099_9PROT|nr:type II secretion system protein GspK [Acetobacter conturbans]NHN87695.1 general secretion pathway protein GspK [Acetobacter conturbans]
MTKRRSSGTRRGEEGFALLLVLWTMGFLALLVSQVLSTGRSAMQLGERVSLQARLETTADAAITTELFTIATSGHAASAVNGMWHPLEGDDGGATVRSVMERGKLNPNTASRALLQAFFTASGLSSEQSSMLAEQIFSWRNPDSDNQAGSLSIAGKAVCTTTGAPFRTSDDLLAVPGMTSLVLKIVSPHLSFSELQQPSAATEDKVVRAALRQTGIAGNVVDEVSDEDTLITVDARVELRGGAIVRHVEVILLPDARPVPWKVMRWETGALPF